MRSMARKLDDGGLDEAFIDVPLKLVAIGAMSGFAGAVLGKGLAMATRSRRTARQLYDFKSGARDGRNALAMKPVVANLTDRDIVDLTAYVVSLQPGR